MRPNLISILKKKENLLMSLLFFIAAILPLIIYTYIRERSIYSLDFIAYPLKRGDYDFFHYCKAVVLIIVSFFLVTVLISKREYLKSIMAIPLMLFGFMILSSSIFSDYRAFAFFGGAESYQGVLVWLSYIVLCLAASQIQSIKNIKRILAGVVLSGFLLSVIGFLEYFNSDFFEAYLKFFLEGDKKINYKDTPAINSLSYNPNYYSVFLYLTLTVLVVAYLLNENKKRGILLLLVYSFVYFNLVGVKTLAADITFVLATLIIIVFLWIKKRLDVKRVLIIIGVSLSIFFFVFHNIGASPIQKKPGNRFKIAGEHSTFNEAKVSDSILELRSFKHPSLFVKLKNGKDLNFSKEIDFNNVLDIKNDKNKVTIDDQDFKGYAFSFKKLKQGNLMVFNYNEEFDYNIIIDGKTFKTINPHTNKVIDIVTTEKVAYFNKRGALFSGRGIIWALGIPKIEFFGHGADTFPLVFPNNDYLSKLKQYRNSKRYPAAAHSLYLQIAIEFGVLGLLLFACIIIFYLFTTIKLLLSSSFNTASHYISLGCCMAVFGFCFLGITNSSMLTSSPNFWILLGLGIAVNGKIGNKNSAIS